ncbi:MAG: D-proline reductase (dithiol) PrdB [Verrucomicrobiales bacterium]|jgi:D-proline reductase (dithiol) PrdB
MGAPAPEELDAVDYIQVTRDSYASLGFDAYRWADNSDEPPAFVPPTKPLSDSKVVLIASGGVYRVGDVGFSHKDDLTYREIPIDTPTDDLRVTHFAYDQTNARSDVNAVFPIDSLLAMASAGEIGELAEVALTFMGGIYSQRRLGETLTPAIVDRVHELEADIALLVPV